MLMQVRHRCFPLLAIHHHHLGCQPFHNRIVLIEHADHLQAARPAYCPHQEQPIDVPLDHRRHLYIPQRLNDRRDRLAYYVSIRIGTWALPCNTPTQLPP